MFRQENASHLSHVLFCTCLFLFLPGSWVKERMNGRDGIVVGVLERKLSRGRGNCKRLGPVMPSLGSRGFLLLRAGGELAWQGRRMSPLRGDDGCFTALERFCRVEWTSSGTPIRFISQCSPLDKA